VGGRRPAKEAWELAVRGLQEAAPTDFAGDLDERPRWEEEEGVGRPGLSLGLGRWYQPFCRRGCVETCCVFRSPVARGLTLTMPTRSAVSDFEGAGREACRVPGASSTRKRTMGNKVCPSAGGDITEEYTACSICCRDSLRCGRVEFVDTWWEGLDPESWSCAVNNLTTKERGTAPTKPSPRELLLQPWDTKSGIILGEGVGDWVPFVPAKEPCVTRARTMTGVTAAFISGKGRYWGELLPVTSFLRELNEGQ
jgi:hypothetical protein